MLPNDGQLNDPVMVVAPDGTTVHIPRDEYDRYRQERDQPSPVHSDGELRDMVDPSTGLDQGGNPLQEGIWATTDGGWKPDGKRDESFTSSYRIAGTVVTPHATAGIHNGPLNLLSKLKSISVDGIPVNAENAGAIYQMYGHPGEGKFGQPVQVSAHHPAFENLAARIIQDGHGYPDAYKNDVQALQQGIRAGEIPPPIAPSDGIVPVASVYASDLDFMAPETAEASPSSYDAYQETPGGPSPEGVRRIQDHHLNRALKQNGMAGHQLNWTPGMRGRGLMIGRNLHTWDSFDPNTYDGTGEMGPMHSEYARTLPIDPKLVDYRSGVEIHPDGGVESVTGYPTDKIISADPRLHPKTTDDLFNFSHVFPDIVKRSYRDPILETHIEMPWYIEDPVLDKKSSVQKETAMFAPLLEGATSLIGAAAPTIMRSALGHGAYDAGKSLLGGGQTGGDSGGTSMPPDPPLDASYYGKTADLSTPSSNPGFSEAKDGDTKQFDADSTSTNPDNPTKGGPGGATEGEDGVKTKLFDDNSEGLKRLEMVLPLVLHYHNSEDEGINDPILRSLHELLEEESPGYLDHGDDHASVEALLTSIKKPDKIEHHQGAVPMPATNAQQPLNQQAPAVSPQTPSSCPNCGGTLLADGSCPQCGAKANPMGAPVPVAPQAGMPPTAFQGSRQAADHQGPVTKEQQAAVAQLLTENGRQNEIVTMIQSPWDYADELAQVAHRLNIPPNVDPNEQAPSLPEPAQESAPPGATMPVPNPADPSQQAMYQSSIIASDNLAPNCPNCGSGTTATDDGEKGLFHCHACHHVWKNSDKFETVESKTALSDAPGINLNDAEQHSIPDPRENQDTSQSWHDNANQPLSAGSTYQMHSDQYSIPDIVKIMAVKPEALVVQTVGDYTNNGTGPVVHEISKQEADMDNLTFIPADNNTDQQPDPGTADASPASQINTEPQQTPDLNAQPQAVNSSVISSRDWLRDDTNFDIDVTSNYEKTAGKKYTPNEQRDFIDERGIARNQDKLDLSGTHYEHQSRHLDDEFALFSL